VAAVIAASISEFGSPFELTFLTRLSGVTRCSRVCRGCFFSRRLDAFAGKTRLAIAFLLIDSALSINGRTKSIRLVARGFRPARFYYGHGATYPPSGTFKLCWQNGSAEERCVRIRPGALRQLPIEAPPATTPAPVPRTAYKIRHHPPDDQPDHGPPTCDHHSLARERLRSGRGLCFRRDLVIRFPGIGNGCAALPKRNRRARGRFPSISIWAATRCRSGLA
jgi:hypothetical protein